MSETQTVSQPPLPKRLSVRWWAAELGLSERTLWKRIASGDLKPVRVGRRVVIRDTDMNAFLAGEQRR